MASDAPNDDITDPFEYDITDHHDTEFTHHAVTHIVERVLRALEAPVGDVEFDRAQCAFYKDHRLVDTDDGRAWEIAETTTIRLALEFEAANPRAGELVPVEGDR